MNGGCTFERSKHGLYIHNGDTFSDSPLFIYLFIRSFSVNNQGYENKGKESWPGICKPCMKLSRNWLGFRTLILYLLLPKNSLVTIQYRNSQSCISLPAGAMINDQKQSTAERPANWRKGWPLYIQGNFRCHSCSYSKRQNSQ